MWTCGCPLPCDFPQNKECWLITDKLYLPYLFANAKDFLSLPLQSGYWHKNKQQLSLLIENSPPPPFKREKQKRKSNNYQTIKKQTQNQNICKLLIQITKILYQRTQEQLKGKFYCQTRMTTYFYFPFVIAASLTTPLGTFIMPPTCVLVTHRAALTHIIISKLTS